MTGANNLNIDDISALVAYNGRIGVMWSNQNADTMYFASHADGAADSAWTLNPALQGPKYADDRINLKSLQADASGQVFAAVKTSLNDVNPPTSQQPLILLLILDGNGGWQRRTFGTVADFHTRPLVLIDNENRQLYMFAVSPCCSGGVIYYKRTSLTNPNFSTGLGTPFIQLSTDVIMTNPTSTKQALNSTTGLLVEAADDHTQFYAHNKMTLGAVDNTPPDTTIDTGPSGAVGSTSATFTFSSSETGSTFGCTLDGGALSACTSPTTYTSLAAGAHTFTARATDPAGNPDPTAASRTWTVDLTAPAPPLISSPTEGSLIASHTVGLAGSAENGATVAVFEGATARGTTTASGSGAWSLTLTAVPDGAHTYSATATDPAGNTSGPSAGRTITVDATAPDTTIDAGPSGTATSDTATFAFSSSETGSTFGCTLDGGALSACTSPTTYTSLAAGAHTFTVRATVPAGNFDPTAASRTWTVDNTPPDTTIDTGPSGAVGSTSATFTFSSSETGSTFGCTLDGGALSACTSPTTYTSLAAGAHTFTARATDPAGNPDPTPASRTWTVDLTAPAPPLISSPTEGSLIASHTVGLAGSAENGATVAVFEGATARGTTTASGSGAWSLTLTAVPDGAHTYSATATDPAGNTSGPSAGRTITVDATAPDTTIDAGPSGTATSDTATFAFSSSETGSTFGCTLDGGALSACTSPTTYTSLAAGAHTFTVRATDPAGNFDPTAASRTWTVDNTPPDTTIDTGPSGAVGSTSATFTFSSSETGSTFGCTLDGGALSACTSPTTYTCWPPARTPSPPVPPTPPATPTRPRPAGPGRST